jgi:DNA repair exonuclease SbcCD nuclease subunit
MKIVALSDLHCHPFQYGAKTLPSGRNSRLEATLAAIGEVRQAASARGIRVALCLGDVLHVPGRIDTQVLNGLYHELCEFSAAGIHVALLVGNHDLASSGRDHGLRVFSALPHVTILDKPGWYQPLAGSGLSVFAVPYLVDADRVRRILRDIPPPPAGTVFRVLAMHAGFDGARVGPSEYRMANELSAGDIVGDWSLVLAGHYHMPQWICEEKRALYVGALTAHNWGDVDSPRGYLIADLATGAVERFESSAPRFLRLAPDQLNRARAGDIVEVVLPNDADDTAMDAAKAALDQVRPSAGQVVRAPSPEAGPIARLECGLTADVGALLAPYVDHVSTEAPEDERQALVALGRAYMQRAGE